MAIEEPGLVVTHYCVGCGKGLIASAAMCPVCGTLVKATTTFKGKDKTVAVILAVFLSGWTWLYTYRVNAAKFWVYIGVSFLIGLIALAVFWLVPYDPGPVFGALAVFYLVSFGFWLWAVIDSATKPRDYYKNYE